MFCPQCGTSVGASAKFCPYCGHALPTTGMLPHSPDDKPPPNKRTGDYSRAQGENIQGPVHISARKSRKKYLIAGLLGAIFLIAIVVYIIDWGRLFDPRRMKESGSYSLDVGDSIYLDSIDSTLEFASADILSVDYNALTVSLTWDLCLRAGKPLYANESRQRNICADWISTAYYNGENTVSNITTNLDYDENCVWYDLTATVNYDEVVDSLECVIGDNLDVSLQYAFPYSSEQILMGKADSYLSTGQFDQALALYQEIGTEEALRKIQSINCIDYAEQVINYLNASYTPAANLLGMDTTFEFDVESYTFIEHRYLPSYMDSVSGWLGIDYGFGEEYGDAALNEEANIERAKELYDEYFAAEGFPDITCTLVVYKSNGEWLGEFSYPQSTPSASGTSEGNTTADVDYSWIEGTYLLAHAAMIQLNLSFSTPRPWENGDDWGINWSITESNFDGSVDILGEGTATYVGGGECPEFRGTFDSDGSSIQLKYDGYNFVVNCESLRLDGDGSFFKA